MSRIGYELTDVDGMRALLVRGYGWSDELLELARRERVEYVSVAGVESDISFVAELPWVRRLVLTVQKPRDLRPLERLESVEELMLQLGTGRTPPVALDKLKRLVDLSCDWIKGLESIADCQQLDSLLVGRPPGRDLGWLASLSRLRNLALENSRTLEALDGIEKLTGLRSLKLSRLQRLKTLEGVQRVPQLERLEVEGCRRLDGLEPATEAKALRALAIDDGGVIQSLAPIRALVHLEEFYAVGTTEIQDGDLTPLLDLPHLQRFAMASRKRYLPSVTEVEAAIAAAQSSQA